MTSEGFLNVCFGLFILSLTFVIILILFGIFQGIRNEKIQRKLNEKQLEEIELKIKENQKQQA